MQKTFVRIENLTKRYGEVEALRDISLDIKQGELFGIIGPDGAGKTTLMRILVTLILPDSGEAAINGREVVKDWKYLRKHIGYMPGTFSLYEDLTIEENLHFFATIFGTTKEENYDLIKEIYEHIEPFKDRKAGQLSGGMKQKLALSCALIHRPDFLVLDEPTTGIDAVSRVELWEMLGKLKDEGLTILVSTPYMDEAELCDRVAFLQDGVITEVNAPDTIKKEFDQPLYAMNSKDNYELLMGLRKMDMVRSAFLFGENIHVVTNHSYGEEELQKAVLEEAGIRANIRPIHAGIEDCFMSRMMD